MTKTLGAGNIRKAVPVAVILAVVLVGGILWATRKPVKPNGTGPGGDQKPPQTPPGMIYIPGGKFIMGDDRSADPASKPEHEVSVNHFFLDKYEVTNEAYQRFLEAKPSYPAPEKWSNRKYPAGQGRYPITGVTWGEARDYARWAGKRLPKEEEWEYAARGTDKRIYPWGNDYGGAHVNTKEAGLAAAAAVDAYPEDKSPFGVIGMAGNVAEWIGALYEPYPKSEALPMPNNFIIRGGNFRSDSGKCAITSRFVAKPEEKADSLGFRCAMDVPKQ